MISALMNQCHRLSKLTPLLLCGSLLGACSGGDDSPASDLLGDDARRLVLSDIGTTIIMPALRDFATKADAMNQAVSELSNQAASSTLRSAAQSAWREAMLSWQYLEPLQVGPAGLSTGLDGTRGGADLRGDIYAFPLLSTCTIEELAHLGLTVNEGSASNTIGLGALEFLLFNEESNPCALNTPASTAQRADYAASAALSVRDVAADLQQRWEPDGGNFLGQWSSAGDGSEFYLLPQNALNALSVALFYVDKQTKDIKIASPTGIGASGLEECDAISCPERLESSLSGLSGDNIRANIQVFLDVFQGVNDGRGLNDLLTGIGREDLANKITTELTTTLEHLDAMQPDFDESLATIPSKEACINGTANPSPEVPPSCALHGYLKNAMDTFRSSIVAVLSLSTPASTAGDND